MILIIVGAGPAGIFTALELLSKSNLKIVIIKKGKKYWKKNMFCRKIKKCLNCEICDMLNGWEGAGSFSDGKT